MKDALVFVSRASPVEAVALVAVAGGAVLEIDVCRTLEVVSRAVLCDVALPTGGPAGGAVRSELAVGLAAETSAALCSASQPAGLGVTAGVCTLLWGWGGGGAGESNLCENYLGFYPMHRKSTCVRLACTRVYIYTCMPLKLRRNTGHYILFQVLLAGLVAIQSLPTAPLLRSSSSSGVRASD